LSKIEKILRLAHVDHHLSFRMLNFLPPTGKMTMFGAIFEVNSSIGRLWDLFGHFNEKDTVNFK